VTGDELVSPGTRLAHGKTYNANAAAVASLVAHYGGIPRILGIARDTENALIAKIRKGITADVIITTGGVSKGDYDLVRLVLGRIGKIIFSKINMGPGAAVAFGAIKRASDIGPGAALPVFSLAGPPAGCLVNFETLVRPALLKMRGFANVDHPWIEATAVDAVPRTMSMSFVKYADLRETGGEYRVTLNLGETMGMLASIAGANALAVLPAKAAVKAGDRVRVLPLDWCR
jgi:molybdopterin molybdotransferase